MYYDDVLFSVNCYLLFSLIQEHMADDWGGGGSIEPNELPLNIQAFYTDDSITYTYVVHRKSVVVGHIAVVGVNSWVASPKLARFRTRRRQRRLLPFTFSRQYIRLWWSQRLHFLLIRTQSYKIN